MSTRPATCLGLTTDLVKGVDDFVEMLIFDRRPTDRAAGRDAQTRQRSCENGTLWAGLADQGEEFHHRINGGSYIGRIPRSAVEIEFTALMLSHDRDDSELRASR